MGRGSWENVQRHAGTDLEGRTGVSERKDERSRLRSDVYQYRSRREHDVFGEL